MGGIKEMKKTQLLFLNDFQFEWSANKKENIQYHASSSIEKLELDTTIADIQFYEKENLDEIIVNVSNVYSGFEVEEDHHKLTIDQPHYWTITDDSKKAKIEITIPKGMQFHEVDICANAGVTKTQNIKTKELSIENSAGKLTIDNIICNNMEIDAGMCQMDLSQVTCFNHLDIDMGMGDINILFNTDINDYTYSIDVGMGSVQIGDMKYSGIVEKDSHHTESSQHIDVDCGMGSVKIETEE